jgi:hypothetical protein
MSWTCGFGRPEADRLEAGLSTWLRSFEPVDVPIACRLRTFRDLRIEAGRPRPRLGFVGRGAPVLACAACIAAAALVGLLLAARGHAISVGAGALGPSIDVQQPGSDVSSSVVPNPVAILGLLVVSVLAGSIVLLPRARAAFGRVMFGRDTEAASDPAPVRRRSLGLPFLVAAATVAGYVLLTLVWERLADYQRARLTGLLNPVTIAALLMLATIAGSMVLVPRIRAVIGTLMFGRDREATASLRPMRSGSVSVLVWVLGAASLVYMALTFAWSAGADSSANALGFPWLLAWLLVGPFFVLKSVAVPIRYRLTERSSQLLLAGVLIPLANDFVIAASLAAGVGVFLLPFFAILSGLTWVLGCTALAAGLARRSGRRVRPPLALAAVAAGALFAARVVWLFTGYDGWPLDRIAPLVVQDIMGWLGDVALLAAAWVCFVESRRGVSPGPWALMLVAAVASLLMAMPMRALSFVQLLSPAFGIGDAQGWAFAWWWTMNSIIATATAAVGLLAGLRASSTESQPVVTEADPAV